MNAVMLALAVLLVILSVGVGGFGCFLLFLLGRVCWYAQEAYFRGLGDTPEPVQRERRGLMAGVRSLVARLTKGKRRAKVLA